MAKRTPKTLHDMAPVTLEGQTLGRYRILEPLGRGGMAQVYKAYHPQLNRYVAVKVLRSDLVEEVEFLARFQREARAVARLRHPNIVQVYDFDIQNELYYMVMELLEGDTLKAYLNAVRTRRERIPLGDTVRILTDALSGLAYAHGEGVIHRDLKPANLMLTRRGQAVLTDFGIAQIVGGTQYTVQGALMGTLNYMAPEQGRDGKCDARSDLYSLGITYYEALTGSVPFDADTPLAILMKHLNDPLPLPRELDPAIPEVFESVALKALAKDPDDRYQSASEMAAALQAAARTAGIEIPDVTGLPRVVVLPAPQPRAVKVFSGHDRQQIPDSGFAAGDTAITFHTSTASAAGKPGGDAGRAALASVAVIIFGNMTLLWACGVFGWDLFSRSWPLELLLAGVLFFALMLATKLPWFVIPGGIVLGNGLVFSYYALSGRWQDWSLLWPLEPVLIAASIVAPFWIKKRRDGGARFIRRFGIFSLILAGLVFIVTLVVAIITSS